MKTLKELLALFKSIWNPITEKNNRLLFFASAIQCLGTDVTPTDIYPDEYNCAETVNVIHTKAFGFPIGGDISTYRLYAALKNSPYFKKVLEPLEGDLIISPTGYGRIEIMTGHVGIIGESGKVMSNRSKTGTFEENYTLKTWKETWVDKGKYPMFFYRRI